MTKNLDLHSEFDHYSLALKKYHSHLQDEISKVIQNKRHQKLLGIVNQRNNDAALGLIDAYFNDPLSETGARFRRVLKKNTKLMAALDKFEKVQAIYKHFTNPQARLNKDEVVQYFRQSFLNLQSVEDIIIKRRDNVWTSILKGAALFTTTIFSLGIGTYAAYQKLYGSKAVHGRKFMRKLTKVADHFAKATLVPVAATASAVPQRESKLEKVSSLAPVTDASVRASIGIKPSFEQVNVVVGLGPAGLAAVLELCSHDHYQRKVIAMTDRMDYTRRQILRFNQRIKDYLDSLLGKKTLITLAEQKKFRRLYDKERKEDYYVIQLKDLEKVLFAEVQKLIGENKLEIIQTHEQQENEISNIDIHKHVVRLKSGRDIHFDLLCEADGGQHNLATLLHDKINIDIEYVPGQIAQLNHWHVIANFRLPKRMTAEDYQALVAEGPGKKFNQSRAMAKLRDMGWKLKSTPETRLFMVDDNFYIGVECPVGMDKSLEAKEAWARQALKLHLPKKHIKALSLHVDYRERPECYLLEIELNEACNVFYKFPKAMASMQQAELHAAMLVIFGDALRKAHYQTASGAVTGLLEVQAFSHFLASSQKKSDRKSYMAAIEQIRTDNRKRVDAYLTARARREVDAPAWVEVPVKNNLFKKKSQRKPAVVAAVTVEAAAKDENLASLEKACGVLQLTPADMVVGDLEANLRVLEKKKDELLALISKDWSRRYKGPSENEVKIAYRRLKDELTVRQFKSRTHFLSDYTSTYNFNSLAKIKLAPHQAMRGGSFKDVCLSFSSHEYKKENGAYSKSYHFYKFDVDYSWQGFEVTNPKYLQLVIAPTGDCMLRFPDSLGSMHQAILARFVVPFVLGGNGQNMAKSAYKVTMVTTFGEQPKIVPAQNEFGMGFDHVLELKDEKRLAAVIDVVHKEFCSNAALVQDNLLLLVNKKMARVKVKNAGLGFFDRLGSGKNGVPPTFSGSAFVKSSK